MSPLLSSQFKAAYTSHLSWLAAGPVFFQDRPWSGLSLSHVIQNGLERSGKQGSSYTL